MGIFELLILLGIAAICGAIGQSIAGFSRGGCLAAVALGFIGALLGSKLAAVFGLPELLTIEVGGRAFPIVWSIIGATIFVAIIGLLTGGRRTIDD